MPAIDDLCISRGLLSREYEIVPFFLFLIFHGLICTSSLQILSRLIAGAVSSGRRFSNDLLYFIKTAPYCCRLEDLLPCNRFRLLKHQCPSNAFTANATVFLRHRPAHAQRFSVMILLISETDFASSIRLWIYDDFSRKHALQPLRLLQRWRRAALKFPASAWRSG